MGIPPGHHWRANYLDLLLNAATGNGLIYAAFFNLILTCIGYLHRLYHAMLLDNLISKEKTWHGMEFCGICNETWFLLPVPVAEILWDLAICCLRRQLFLYSQHWSQLLLFISTASVNLFRKSHFVVGLYEFGQKTSNGFRWCLESN